jgi:hypothetical protein
MQVRSVCPQCGVLTVFTVEPGPVHLACSGCGRESTASADAFAGDRVGRCLCCPSTDLYIRKDFPQRLGVAIVALGFLGSCIGWAYHNLWAAFGFLFAAAGVDALLYMAMPDVLVCYRCAAEYRGPAALGLHGHFNLETHEKHRRHGERLSEAAQRAAAVTRAATPTSVPTESPSQAR